MLGLPIVEPKPKNELFACKFKQPNNRRQSVKKRETEHSADQKRRMVGTGQKRMDQFLAVPGDVIMDGASGKRGGEIDVVGAVGVGARE